MFWSSLLLHKMWAAPKSTLESSKKQASSKLYESSLIKVCNFYEWASVRLFDLSIHPISFPLKPPRASLFKDIKTLCVYREKKKRYRDTNFNSQTVKKKFVILKSFMMWISNYFLWMLRKWIFLCLMWWKSDFVDH